MCSCDCQSRKCQDPKVKNVMGQEAGLQEKEKLKGMGKHFECAV